MRSERWPGGRPRSRLKAFRWSPAPLLLLGPVIFRARPGLARPLRRPGQRPLGGGEGSSPRSSALGDGRRAGGVVPGSRARPFRIGWRAAARPFHVARGWESKTCAPRGLARSASPSRRAPSPAVFLAPPRPRSSGPRPKRLQPRRSSAAPAPSDSRWPRGRSSEERDGVARPVGARSLQGAIEAGAGDGHEDGVSRRRAGPRARPRRLVQSSLRQVTAPTRRPREYRGHRRGEPQPPDSLRGVATCAAVMQLGARRRLRPPF